jgi:hypothetical protein
MGEQLCSAVCPWLVVCGASRLAPRATADAATALTRHTRWALALSDGRHGVPARVSVGPDVAIPKHGVKVSEHLRMTATIATFGFSPVATKRRWKHAAPG